MAPASEGAAVIFKTQHTRRTISQHSLCGILSMIDSCRDELLHHTFIHHHDPPQHTHTHTHTHPFHFFLLLSSLWQQRRVNTICPACAARAAHTSSRILSESPRAPTANKEAPVNVYYVWISSRIPEILSVGGLESATFAE